MAASGAHWRERGREGPICAARFLLVLEHPKPRLLPRVEHFVEGVVRLSSESDRSPIVVLPKRRELVAYRALVGGDGRFRPGHSEELADEHLALPLVPAADVLQLLQPRRERPVLVVGDGQLGLGADDGVGSSMSASAASGNASPSNSPRPAGAKRALGRGTRSAARRSR